MIRYLALRLLLALPALSLILTMVFLLAHIVPGDPVQQMLGEGAPAADIQQLWDTLGLDLPLPVQYGRVLAPIPSWRAMLNDARAHLFDAPHVVLFPAFAVMTGVLAFNLVGDALRDWLDPRMRAYLIVTSLAR